MLYNRGACIQRFELCRVYRGDMAAGDDPGMFFISKDGAASVTDIAAYTMGSIWEQASDQPAKTHEPAVE